MYRNRNGYWMSPKFDALFAPDDGAGGGETGANETAGNGGEDGEGGTGADNEGNDSGAGDLAEELERMKGELEKYKKAIDKATKEAADNKRALKEKEQALRSKQTAEEIAAEEKKAQDEQTAKEIEELRREVARTKAVKSVMSKLGTDEETSGKIAEYLYGAEDVDNALMEIQRAWSAREKALRLEYGKVPPPGAGGTNGEDEETAKAIKLAKEMGRGRAKASESVQAQLKGLIR